MDKELLLENIEMEAYSHGKATLVAGMCKKLNIINIFDKYLTKQNGRKPDISYGIIAQMMLANLCHSRRPLYLMDEYFEHIDIEGIFNSDAKPYNLTDDRFGCFLDNFHEADPRKIFSEISMSAFATYGLSIKNINYDTTSKVMWGQYETEEGKIGEISIDYGYSKDKRNDKKQIKIGIGTANGIVVDAKVLSGNTDDKTYNNDAIDDVNEVLAKSRTSKDSFYYVADSAFFTEENIKKANGRYIKFITRAPETTNMSKIYIGKFFSERQLAKDVVFENAQGKEVKYQVLDYKAEYKGIPV
ncbi:IS1634 family transposase, partial [Clostridium chromiireducens]